MKKVDVELPLFLKMFHFTEIKNKKYNYDICDPSYVYVFVNMDELVNYFKDNCVDVDDDVLNSCIVKVTRKGNIIALKSLCDYVIKRLRITKKLSAKEILDIHNRNKITFDEKVSEWEKNKVCAPGGCFDDTSIRCDSFRNCHDCLLEYASILDEYDRSDYTLTRKK